MADSVFDIVGQRLIVWPTAVGHWLMVDG